MAKKGFNIAVTTADGDIYDFDSKDFVENYAQNAKDFPTATVPMYDANGDAHNVFLKDALSKYRSGYTYTPNQSSAAKAKALVRSGKAVQRQTSKPAPKKEDTSLNPFSSLKDALPTSTQVQPREGWGQRSGMVSPLVKDDGTPMSYTNTTFAERAKAEENAGIKQTSQQKVKQMTNDIIREQRRKDSPYVPMDATEEDLQKTPYYLNRSNREIEEQDSERMSQWGEGMVSTEAERITSEGIVPAEADAISWDIISALEKQKKETAHEALMNPDDYSAGSRLAELNKAMSPENVLDTMQRNGELDTLIDSAIFDTDKEGNKTVKARIKREANNMGMSLNGYVSKVVVPAVAQSVNARLYQNEVARQLPKGFDNYLSGKLRESAIGMLVDMATKTKSQRQAGMQAMQQYEKDNVGFWGKVAGAGTTMIGDLPVMAVSGGIGGQMTKATGKALAKVGLKQSVQDFTLANLKSLGWKEGAKWFGKEVALNAPGSMVNLGTFSAIKGVEGELYAGDDSSAWNLLKVAGKEFLTGAAEMGAPMALVHPLGKMSMIWNSVAARVGNKVGAKAGEVLAFAAPEYIHGRMNGEDVRFTDSLINSAAMVTGFGIVGHIQHGKNTIQELRGLFKGGSMNGIKLSKTELDYLKKNIFEGKDFSEYFTDATKDFDVARYQKALKDKDIKTLEELDGQRDKIAGLLADSNIPLQIRQKISIAMAGVAQASTPIFDNFEVQGKTVITRSKEGEAIGVYEFKDMEHLKSILDTEHLRGIQQNAAAYLVKFGLGESENKVAQAAFADALDGIREDTGISSRDEIVKLLTKDPARLTEEEAQNVKSIRFRLQTVMEELSGDHKNTQLAEERGATAAEDADITGDEPKTDIVQGEQEVLQLARTRFSTAEKALNELMGGDDVVRDMLEGKDDITEEDIARMAGQGVAPDAIEAVKEYVGAKNNLANAEARYKAFSEGIDKSIDGLVEQHMAEITHNALDAIVEVKDKDGKVWYLKDGEVTPDGTVVSDSGMVVVRDEEGQPGVLPVEELSDVTIRTKEEMAAPLRDTIRQMVEDEYGVKAAQEQPAQPEATPQPAQEKAEQPKEVKQEEKTEEKTEDVSEEEKATPVTEQPAGPQEPQEVKAEEQLAEPQEQQKDRTDVPTVVSSDGTAYIEAEPKSALDDFKARLDGDEEMVAQAIDDEITDAQEALDKANKWKAKGIKELQEKKAAQIDAQRRLDYWNKVKEQSMSDEDVTEDIQPSGTTTEGMSDDSSLADVPDMSIDKAADARERGFRRVLDARYDRQGEIDGVSGNETEVDFSNKETKTAVYKVVEADSVQPSHLGGQRNPLHFIPEAQPKERTDTVSDAESSRIAQNISPERITASTNAYGGAPIINKRGEVIQGNNRAIALRKMSGIPEQKEKYKQWLMEHAEEFGLKAEDIEKMENPVLVRELDVTDAEAIRLGQFKSSDLETGGIERIDAKQTLSKATDEQISEIMRRLFDTKGESDEQTIAQLIDENGTELLKYMRMIDIISDVQYQSAFDKNGKLSAEAKNDLRKLMLQYIFDGGNDNIEYFFENDLPVAAQKGLAKAMSGDMRLEDKARLKKDVQGAISLISEMKRAGYLTGKKTAEEIRKVFNTMSRQVGMFGEKPINERYTDLELEIAICLMTEKQNKIDAIFKEYQRLIIGTEGDMFTPAEKLTREEAVEKVFNLKEKKGKDDGNDNGGETDAVPQGEGERGEELGRGERPAEGETRAVEETLQSLAQKYEHSEEQKKLLEELVSKNELSIGNVQRKLRVGFDQATDIVQAINKALGKDKYESEVRKIVKNFAAETPEEAAEFDKRVPNMSDKELLSYMKEDGKGDVNKAHHPLVYDEYDARHGNEFVKAYDSSLQQLHDNNTTLKQAEEKLADIRSKKERLTTEDRPQLLGQEDALEDYITEIKNSEDDVMHREGDGRVLSMSQNKKYSKRQRLELMQREWKRMQTAAKEYIDGLHLDNADVYGTIEDMPEAMRNRLSERKKNAKGWFDPKTGKIVIILGNHKNAEDVRMTMLHEAVAHHGLRKLFGKNFDTFLGNVWKHADGEIKTLIADMAAKQKAKDSAANRARRTNEDYIRIATEEYLAKLAESMESDFALDEHSSLGRFYHKVKELFLKMLDTVGLREFKKINLTDNELRYILWRSYKNLEGTRRNVFDVAEDYNMQEKLGVGEAERPKRGEIPDWMLLSQELEKKAAERGANREQRTEDTETKEQTELPEYNEQAAVRHALGSLSAEITRQTGVKVYTDGKEGQEVIDLMNGGVRAMSAKQKRAIETVSVASNEEHHQTVVSTADGAKVLNNLDNLATNLESLTQNPVKTFLGEVAKALEATKHGSNSQYATFETKNGKIVTIRLANHNAKVSTFDNHGEDEGISIVVSPKNNTGTILDGNAHIVEYYYNVMKLRRAEGKPLADIVRAIKQSLYSGEFNDPTGLAERQEVNKDIIREHRSAKDNVSQEIFVSNARRAVEDIKQEKATAEQWLAMLQKNGGLKAGEDKWLGLSDWLKDKKGSVTKQEILDFIAENQIQIEDVHYAENLSEEAMKRLNSYKKEFVDAQKYISSTNTELSEAEVADRAYEKLVEEYGDDFRMAFNWDYVGGNYELIPEVDMEEEITGAAKYFLGIGEGSAGLINSIRLSYTTKGLQNKREIALVVPAIEPYNEHDEIHFGDAGEGRAVAWCRFGETTDKDGKRVLVIDEIQSKRHQDGREKGYRTNSVEELKRLSTEAENNRHAYSNYENEIIQKYDILKGRVLSSDDVVGEILKVASPDEIKKLRDLREAELNSLAVKEEYKKTLRGLVPDAPFDKNWHELVMKRMLRYAVENGYDKVAWTTGEQQAERYSIGNVVDSITSRPYKAQSPTEVDGHDLTVHLSEGYTYDMFVTPEGTLNSDSDMFNGKNVREVFGKDLGTRITAVKEGVLRLEDEDFRIGGEGMKGFYDEILPRFMNKYGKKWGAQVGETELPQVEETGRRMWSVDVTPQMKESVMMGQPMFFRTANGEVYGFAHNGEIYLDPKHMNPETPLHEYTHLWRDMLKTVNPKEWENVKRLLDGVEGLKEETQKLYPELEGDELYDEMLAKYSGREGAKKLEADAKRIAEADGKTIEDSVKARTFVERVRYALRRFWEGTCDLLGIHFTTAEEVADRVLFDWARGVDPTEKRNLRRPVPYPEIGKQKDGINEEEIAESKIRYSKVEDKSTIDELEKGDKIKVRQRVAAQQLIDDLGGKGKVVTAETELDAVGKRALKQNPKATGWYNPETGEVTVYLPNCHGTGEAERTVMHEKVGHEGLRGLMGEEGYKKFMQRIWMGLDGSVRKQLTADYGMDYQKAVDEYLAEKAEMFDDADRSLWQKVKDTWNDVMRGLGFKETSTEDDIRTALWLSKNHLQNKKGNVEYRIRRAAFEHRLRKESLPERTNKDGMAWHEAERSKEWERKNVGVPAQYEGLQEVQPNGELRFRTIKDDDRKAIDKGLTPLGRSARHIYEYKLKSTFYLWQEGLQDNMKALDILQNAICGEGKVKDSENAWMAMNRLGSTTQQELEAFEREYIKPLQDALTKAMTVFDGSDSKERYRNLEDYLIAKHGLERNRVLFVRDTLAEQMKSDDAAIRNAAKTKQSNFDAERAMLRAELDNGNIDLAEYYAQLDDYIKTEISSDFDASTNDMSGLSDVERFATWGGTTDGEYDDAAVIDHVMNCENKMGKDATDTLWNSVRGMSRYEIEKKYQSGLIGKPVKERMENMFDWYIPLRGFDEQTAEETWTYIDGIGVNNSARMNVKTRGRISAARSPLATLQQLCEHAISAGNENVAKQHLYRLVTNNPNNLASITDKVAYLRTTKNGETVLEALYPDLNPYNMGTDRERPLTADEIQQHVEQWEQDIEQRKQNGEDIIGITDTKGDVPYRIVNNANKPQHIVEVSINGQKKHIMIHSHPRAAQAMNGMLRDSGGGKVIKWFNSQMSQLCTSRSLSFMATNAARDAGYALNSLFVTESPKYINDFVETYGMLTGDAIGNLPTSIAGMFPKVNIPDTMKMNSMRNLFTKMREGTLDKSDEIQHYFDEFVKNGAITGYVQMKGLDQLEKQWNKSIESAFDDKGRMRKSVDAVWNSVTKWFKLVENLNEAVENQTRFATYVASRRAGRTIARSVNDAKNISVNFNITGSGDAVKTMKWGDESLWHKINRQFVRGLSHGGKNYLWFFNAGVQGFARHWKMFANGDTAQKAKWLGVLNAVPMSIGYAMPYLSQLIASQIDTDEDKKKYGENPYLELPDYERRSNICIYAGHGRFVKIPMAIEGRVPLAIGDIMHGLFHQPKLLGGKNVYGQFVEAMTQALPIDFGGGSKVVWNDWKGSALGSVTPSGMQPILQSASNIKWTGARIANENQWNERAPEWTKASPSTSETLKNIARWMSNMTGGDDVMPGAVDLSPGKMQNLFEGYSGGVGKELLQFIDATTKEIKGEEVNLSRFPVIKGIYTDNVTENSLRNEQSIYYARQKEYNDILNYIKDYAKKGDTVKSAALKNSTEGKVAAVYDYYAPLINDIRKQKNKATTPADKEELIKQEREMMKKCNELADLALKEKEKEYQNEMQKLEDEKNQKEQEKKFKRSLKLGL